MANLTLAALVFILIHLLVSGTRLRDSLTGKMGERAYMGAFAFASIAIVVWMSFAYARIKNSAENVVYWATTPDLKWAQLGLMLIAFFFVVAGQMTKNPTSVRQEGALDNPDVVQGMLRITRHPFLTGAAIWAGGHMMVNGDRASLTFFAPFLVLGLLGPSSTDAKRRRKLGEERWAPFARQTSAFPFAAIVAGRQKLVLREIGWKRTLVSLIVWAVLIGVHPLLFGVSPLPGH